MIDLVIIGNVLEETIYFPDGHILGPVLGGPVSYSSVAANKLGLKIGIVTKVGYKMPDFLLKAFEFEGIDKTGIIKTEKGTKNNLSYGKDGKKILEFITEAPLINEEDIPAIYLNTDTFFICPINYEVKLSLVKKLHRMGKTIFADLGGYGGAASKRNYLDTKSRISFLRKIAGFFDIIKVSNEDCSYIFGSNLSFEGVFDFFTSLGVCNIIITLGEDGVLIKNSEKIEQIPAFQSNVVDVTGAGDVWCGAFITQYLSNNKDTINASAFANAASAIFIEKSGGLSYERMPSREIVNRLFIEGRYLIR